MRDGTAFPAEALRVVSGPAKESVIPIPDGELQLGREAGQLGALGGDLALSRRHASISHDTAGRLVVEDLGSTNGTFVNGTRISGRRAIQPGDTIELGGSTLQVVAAGSRAPVDDRPTSADGEWDWLGGGSAAPVLAPMAAPAPPPQRREPPRAAESRGSATIEGQIRGIQQRTESYGEGNSSTVWTFRIERYDHSGNRLPPVAVQMRGIGFDGSLTEGDDVRVSGRWKHGTLHTDNVENLTTRATVKTRSFKGALIAFLIIVALMVGGFIILTVRSDQAFQDSTEQAKQEYCEQATELTGDPPPGC
jgi:hypothetical protein